MPLIEGGGGENKMTKEERVVRYLELASMPENLLYDTSHIMKELDVTLEDVAWLQAKRESELSMKPVEKRDIVVKQVIKPLLKKYGFSSSGIDWHREIDDSYIIIHMMNSKFNSTLTGVRFRFHISISKKEEIKEKLSNQWMYNYESELRHYDFLPYCGLLSPYNASDMYEIDGYKNYLPTDTPVEDICRQLEEDFGKYILPELYAINSYEDFFDMRTQKKKQYQKKEVRLLQFYYMAQALAVSLNEIGYRYSMLAERKKDLNLSKEDIMSHLEWLDVCRKNSDRPKVDAKEFVLQFLKYEDDKAFHTS